MAMATTAKTNAERIADLAHFVGRLTDAVFGAKWADYDPHDAESYLTWHEEFVDENTPDEGAVGWWRYKSVRDEVEA